jgi:hypothetical protein
MSVSAPWIRLAIDWQDSPMFGREHGDSDAKMGVRLAWVALLCHTKTKGRGGKVSLRKPAFCRDYNLTAEAVDEMLRRATAHGAVKVNDDLVTFKCWKCYQGEVQGTHVCDDWPTSGESREIPRSGVGGSGISKPKEMTGFAGFWALWPKHPRKGDKAACKAKWRDKGCEAQTDAILASVAAWKLSREWCKQGGEYIPAPLVWLNGERWKNPLPEPAAEGEQPAFLTVPRSEADIVALLEGGNDAA